jgi:flavin reductase (DIM6/NTAB) family NADH-FMN oxidoreductase RutF
MANRKTGLKKVNLPLGDVRRHLEPGPIVLVSSAHKGASDIMVMGWHTMMELEPALFGCYIWDQNVSQRLIRKSRECVINIPTLELLDAVVGVGNTHGDELDKWSEFGLTPTKAKKVGAPLIRECYASFECKLHDDRLVKRYNFFIWEIVRAHVAPVRQPKTLHYRGQGEFMVAGKRISKRAKFRPENL